MSWLACQGGCDVANHVANGNRKFKLSLSHHGNIQQGQKSIQTDKHHLVSEYVDWAFIQDTLSFSVPTPEATNQNTYKGISGSSDTHEKSRGCRGINPRHICSWSFDLVRDDQMDKVIQGTTINTSHYRSSLVWPFEKGTSSPGIYSLWL